MRRLLRSTCLLAASAVLAVGAATVSTASTAAPNAVFVLTGGGWGHGVGMSQWGAYGQAAAGRSFEEILATYYPGTARATAPLAKVRVLVVPKAKKIRLASPVAFRVRDAAGEVVQAAAGELVLGPKLAIGTGPDRRAHPGPLIVKPGAGAPLSIGETSYRGELRVSSDGKTLRVVNTVGLEAYLIGVVPGEMPKEWPLEALKAQAVAARTYAMASLVKDKEFDLFAGPRSQVYYGVTSEAPGTTQAVRETRGTILEFDGKPALTLYSSSSGGRTRSALDTFGLDLPYLRPVNDPWDAAAANPNHRWEAALWSGKQLRAALKLKTRVTDAVTTLGTDGRPTTVRFTTADGATADVSARVVRTRLALRSTSFRIGVLQLFPPRVPASVTGAVPLEGVARDVEAPSLERREADGTWARVKRIVPRADGSFSVVVRPAETTTYRLTGAGLPGPTLRLTAAGAPA